MIMTLLGGPFFRIRAVLETVLHELRGHVRSDTRARGFSRLVTRRVLFLISVITVHMCSDLRCVWLLRVVYRRCSLHLAVCIFFLHLLPPPPPCCGRGHPS